MVKEPVKQCSGKNLVSQKAAPIGKAGSGGQQNRAVLIARGDQLKEMMCLSGRKLGLAHLVDHQHTWGAVATEALAN
jgi:hypothetical protein